MNRWLFLVLLAAACSSKHYSDDDDGGAGGDTGSGGTSAGGKGGKGNSGGSGATSATGGSGASTGKGGSNAQGGTDLVGGTSAGGGASGTQASGGDSSVGGDTATGLGGVGDAGMSNGGEPPTGDGGTGGSNGGTGGTNGGTGGSTGGSGGSAGSALVSCDSSFSVGNDGFVRMLAHEACWHGYAFSGKSSASSLSPTTWSNCGPDCQLAVVGTLSGSSSAYGYLGFYLNQAPGSASEDPVTPTGTGIKITHTYTSVLKAYLELHVSGTEVYCVELPASGTTVPYASFKTACWDQTGTTYAKQPLSAIEVSIEGNDSPADFDLHITSIAEL